MSALQDKYFKKKYLYKSTQVLDTSRVFSKLPPEEMAEQERKLDELGIKKRQYEENAGRGEHDKNKIMVEAGTYLHFKVRRRNGQSRELYCEVISINWCKDYHYLKVKCAVGSTRYLTLSLPQVKRILETSKC